jgi:hypothetical protein
MTALPSKIFDLDQSQAIPSGEKLEAAGSAAITEVSLIRSLYTKAGIRLESLLRIRHLHGRARSR